MAPTSSSLVSKIQYIFQNTNYHGVVTYRLSIGLRNLETLLVCLRSSGDGDGDTHAKQSLFSRIDDAIDGISLDEYASTAHSDSLSEVNSLVEEVNDEWYTNTMSDRLTLEELVQIADSALQNTADFGKVMEVVELEGLPSPVTLRHAMDELDMHTRFLRNFLLFVKGNSVEDQQLQSLLIQIRPFAMNAVRFFIFDDDVLFIFRRANWVDELQSKCPRLDSRVFHAYTRTLLGILRFDDDDDVLKDFLSSLISLLWHVLRHHLHPHLSDSLKALYECLRLSRSILKRSHHDFEANIGVLIRDAGILICFLFLSNDEPPPHLPGLLRRFDVVRAYAAHLPPKSNYLALNFVDSASTEEILDGKVQVVATMASNPSNSTPRDESFQEDEVSLVLDRLTRGSKQLRLVPISGMAGLGKTTFALKIYNHPSALYRFQVRAWCVISQVFDKNRVLLKLLKQIQPEDYTEMDEDDIANKLRQSLKGKRYLILLDDVWSPQVLESLRSSFPNDETQSRIVLTSRLHVIVPAPLPDEQPYFLRLRKENECLEIMENKLVHKVGWSTEVGTKFAKLCNGLPLMAVLVAGLLETTMHEGWEEILDHLSSGGMSGLDQCKIVLELSYKNLPDHLKLCFIYFGVFPEDTEIYAKKLIHLWTAEGFVSIQPDLLKKRSEDIAHVYLDNLIQRNLVMVARKTSLGGIKTCRIHDLLHDFCLMIGKQENIFHRLLQSHDELSDFNESCNLESRLSIHSTALHLKESKLFCPLAHSMLFFQSVKIGSDSRLPDLLFIIQTFELLKVMDMDQMLVNSDILSEIELLTRLTYLSVNCSMFAIPSSIGNLSNLETLIITFKRGGGISLPDTIWNLRKLKYLRCSGFTFSFPVENLENSSSLLDLETIRGIEFYLDESMEVQMRKFPNIRRLKCDILRHRREVSVVKFDKILLVVPEFVSQLESVSFNGKRALHCQFYFGCAESLRKVTLKGVGLSREEIVVIGKLPNLEVLKLDCINFLGSIMEMEEGEFSKLRIFVLHEYDWGNLKTWIATGDEQLPCLEKLVFHGCKKLIEIPYSCLETSSTLEEIDVNLCSSALENLVRGIEEVQNDFGNLINVHIIYSEPEKSESEEEEEEEEEEEDEKLRGTWKNWRIYNEVELEDEDEDENEDEVEVEDEEDEMELEDEDEEDEECFQHNKRGWVCILLCCFVFLSLACYILFARNW